MISGENDKSQSYLSIVDKIFLSTHHAESQARAGL